MEIQLIPSKMCIVWKFWYFCHNSVCATNFSEQTEFPFLKIPMSAIGLYLLRCSVQRKKHTSTDYTKLIHSDRRVNARILSPGEITEHFPLDCHRICPWRRFQKIDFSLDTPRQCEGKEWSVSLRPKACRRNMVLSKPMTIQIKPKKLFATDLHKSNYKPATPRCGCPVGSPHTSLGCCRIQVLWAGFVQNILVFSWNVWPTRSHKMLNHTETWDHQIAAIFGKKGKYPTTKETQPKMMHPTNAKL